MPRRSFSIAALVGTTTTAPATIFRVGNAMPPASLLNMGPNGAVAQLCPCLGTATSQQWSAALDASSYLKTVANATEVLTIEPGPPQWGPEGSGAVVAPMGYKPGMEDYQKWKIDTKAKQVFWPHNSSMCLTVLPPNPAPKALVGLWFCGRQGFEAAQSFQAVATAVSDYQLQLETSENQLLCVSIGGSC